MSNVKLGKDSLQKLGTIKPELRKVCELAFTKMPFDIKVLEGIRTLERQKELLAQKATKTLKSKHLTGDAVDLAPYPIDWNDVKRFNQMAEVMLDAAKELGINVVWGGNWSDDPHDPKGKFVDCPHFELRR